MHDNLEPPKFLRMYMYVCTMMATHFQVGITSENHNHRARLGLGLVKECAIYTGLGLGLGLGLVKECTT